MGSGEGNSRRCHVVQGQKKVAKRIKINQASGKEVKMPTAARME